MKKPLLQLAVCQLAILFCLPALTQPLEPYDGCPGTSVAITRPGFNNSPAPFQIFLIDSTGNAQATGNPINLQINGFGLNNMDGFLYGIHESFNVADPYLSRVDRNGNFENVGRIVVPNVGPFKAAVVNTAAGTMDDEDNYYYTALLINLQNILLPPELYVGKINRVSRLIAGDRPLSVQYKKIDPGTCVDELLAVLQNPLNGVFQDIAFNRVDGNIYSYLPGVTGIGAKIVSFDPDNPVFNCIDPPSPNPATAELSGLFFDRDSSLFILTTDGNYYSADVVTGVVTAIGPTNLPMANGNLRGDMASCVGAPKPASFDDCPGVALAITRTGFNSTGGAFHIYKINPANGDIQPVGHDIDLQINALGLNSKDGFLYGMHEVSNVFNPFISRVDSNGDYVDLGTLSPPLSRGNRVGIINTAAATMDGQDNYYFTAVVVDTAHIFSLPRLYLGTIRNVSRIQPGEPINVIYDRVFIGSCIGEIFQAIFSGSTGILQDMAFNPKDGRLYTYIQTDISPAPGKLAYLGRLGNVYILNCIDPGNENVLTQDLSGMHADDEGNLFILTIDGKYYSADRKTGAVSEIAQTALPLLDGNLRGDMASCVAKGRHDHDYDYGRGFDDLNRDENIGILKQNSMLVAPNPVNGNELSLMVHSLEATNAELKIVDANGRMMQTKRLALMKGENILRVQLTGSIKGILAAVLVYPSGKTITSKFIRQ